MAFDWSDTTNRTLWVGSTSATLFDQNANVISDTVPDSYGHLFRSTDAGLTWTPVHGSGAHTLPNGIPPTPAPSTSARGSGSTSRTTAAPASTAWASACRSLP
jgi:hypothetical protein